MGFAFYLSPARGVVHTTTVSQSLKPQYYPSPFPSPRIMRVLVFHGFAQNGAILRKKLSAIVTDVKDCEFVFGDGPTILAPSDADGSRPTTTAAELAEIARLSPELTARAWLRHNSETGRYDGVDKSILYVRDLMAKERFDGIFGFSQGATFASLICAILEKPHLYPEFLIDGKSPHPPVKFCIAVAGFIPRDPALLNLYETPLTTPALIVLGTNDLIVPEERSKRLADAFANARIERHDGGHFVPSKASWRSFFRDYIMSFDETSTRRPEDVSSPSSCTTPSASGLGPVDSRGASPTHDGRTKL